jgi:hypothetical protein
MVPQPIEETAFVKAASQYTPSPTVFTDPLLEMIVLVRTSDIAWVVRARIRITVAITFSELTPTLDE